MASVGFAVRQRGDLGEVREIVPVIDGVELLDLVHRFELAAGMETGSASYGGLIPALFRFVVTRGTGG